MERRQFIQYGSLGVGMLAIKPNGLRSFVEDGQDDFRIKIIYNNMKINSELQEGGGFSAWVERNDAAVLFDTGGDGLILSNNLDRAALDLKKIRAVVLSHNHWDHVYGLPEAVDRTSDCRVFVPDSFKGSILEQCPGAAVRPVKKTGEVIPGIWTTGEIFTNFLGRRISEQSVVLKREREIAILTGCAHPGIVHIVRHTKRLFPNHTVGLLAGGFHLVSHTEEQSKKISDELKSLGVGKVAPSHCTGDRAIQVFKEEWKEKCLELYLGDECRF